MASKESEERQQIVQAVTCPLPGFEGVTITYNLMATAEQVNTFIRLAGAGGSDHGVIVNVEGWLQEQYGPDPWDTKRVPGLWQAWAARKGYGLAMKAYLDDPNS